MAKVKRTFTVPTIPFKPILDEKAANAIDRKWADKVPLGDLPGVVPDHLWRILCAFAATQARVLEPHWGDETRGVFETHGGKVTPERWRYGWSWGPRQGDMTAIELDDEYTQERNITGGMLVFDDDEKRSTAELTLSELVKRAQGFILYWYGALYATDLVRWSVRDFIEWAQQHQYSIVPAHDHYLVPPSKNVDSCLLIERIERLNPKRRLAGKTFDALV